MKNLRNHFLLSCMMSLLLSFSVVADNGIENFCFDGDIPEAQMSFENMCLTAPVLFCPPTYLGCIGDNIDTTHTGVPTALPGEAACPDPVISFLDIVSTDTACLKIIHRMWSASYPPGSASIKLISTCHQTIYLEDTSAPTLTNCPANITLDLTQSCDSTAVWQNPSVSDDCGISSFTVSHASGSSFPSGNTTVTYTAIDNCGQSTECSFTVSVVGSCCTQPTIACPSDAEVCPISGNIDPANLGYAAATPSNPGCDPPVITYNDVITSSGPCAGQQTIERTWTASDPNDASYFSTCIQAISVLDNENPIILNTPSNITVNGSGSNCQIPVSWVAPTATDNCDIASFVPNHASGSTFSEGTTTVTYIATDNCGNSATASFTVTVICLCNANPIITCPADFISCPQGTYPEPSWTGTATAVPGDSNCDAPVVTYSDVILAAGPCVGGNDIIRTWTATDPSNPALQVSCDQRITLSDDGPPTISNMPTDITLFKKGVHCSMPVTWSEPDVSDDCGVISFESSHPNGGSFSEGTTTITYTATDACGHMTIASFNITIECNNCDTPPTITCPANYSTCPGSPIPLPIVSGEATASFAGGTCGAPIIYYTDGIAAFGTCPGTVVINRTWVAFDSYNPALSSTCTQVIEINDTSAPTFSNVPADITVYGDGNGCQAVALWSAPIANDDCGIQSVVSSANSGSLFPEGVTTVTYTATDNCGNVSNVSFLVTVVCETCTTPPFVNCPADFYGCPNTSTDPSVTGYAVAGNSDPDCNTPVLNYVDTYINAPPCTGAVTIERIWTATDPNNTSLNASCIQYIYLSDDQAPTISALPSDITVNGNGTGCQVPVNWATPHVTDNCNASLTSNYASGHTFSEGTTTVVYTAVDACGNVATASFTVTVICASCNTPPSITCPPHYTNCPGTSYDPWVTGYATAVNNGTNCTGTPIITYSDQTTNNASCTGSMNIIRTWTATNSTNSALSASCVQYINVVDNQSPLINNLPSDITINGTGSGCLEIANWNEPYATDNCGLASFASNFNSGSYFSEGVTTVIYTAIDNCGNVKNASFTVTVLCSSTCNDAPIIDCPPDYWACPSGGTVPPSGTAYAIPGGPNCGTPIVTYSDLIVSTGPCPFAKIIQRTWTATDPDNSALSSSCVQQINLEDNTPPEFTFVPADITVQGKGSNCAIVGTWSPCLAVDNCGSVTITYSHPSGTVFYEGTTPVTVTATDACGNVSVASFNIVVVCAASCTTPPTVSCPPNYTACPAQGIPGPGICGTANGYPGSSYCSSPVVSYNDIVVSSGPCTNAKVIHRTWTATDPNNSSLYASCVQTISLVDNQAPVFASCPNDIFLYGTNPTGSGSGCYATAHWNVPTVYDNCGVTSLVATDQYGNVVTSGSSFSQGTTVITYTATDACGNISTCSFDIHVSCPSGGSIVCPDDIVVQCDGSVGCKIVNWSSPTYNGACGSCQGAPIPGFMYMGEFNGHEYYCSLDPLSWADASQMCADNGGYLACINSQAENDFLANLLTIQSAWIGLGDPNHDGVFTWECGDPLSYTNWYPGQPNNYNGNQDCVEILNNGQWNDQYPYYLLEFIMEKPCSFINQVGGPLPGSCLSGGTYTVTYETNDACGPIETCSFTITVEDALTITCPDDIYTSAPINSSGVVVNWAEPEVSSCCTNCPSAGGYIPGFIYMGSFNGHHYYCSTGTDTWANAQANCVANGGHLAVINSAAENTYLANILTLQSAWIGANDLAVEGSFQWVNGDPFVYTNWYPGQPNNYNNNQHCVEMLNNGEWNDQYGHYSLEYIMEIESCLNIEQISGPAPGSVLPPGSQHTVTYQATDGCGNVEICSFDINVAVITSNDQNCGSAGHNSQKHWIERVTIGPLDNTTGNDGGYGDYSDQCATFESGETFNIQLFPGQSYQVYEKVYWTVFVDFNGDGDFDENGEFAAYGCGAYSVNGMIDVPSNSVTVHGTIRIVMSAYDYQTDPCEPYDFGETEDYCIIINGKPPVNGVTTTDSFTDSDLSTRNFNREAVLLETQKRVDYGLRVFPNPVSEVMTVQISSFENIERVGMYSVNGQLIQEYNLLQLQKDNRVYVSDLESGFYLLKSIYKDGHTETAKVIIQK